MRSVIDQMSNVKESALSYMYGCAKQGNPLDIKVDICTFNGLDDNERAHLVDPAAENNWFEGSGSYKIAGDTKTIIGNFKERFYFLCPDTYQVTCKVRAGTKTGLQSQEQEAALWSMQGCSQQGGTITWQDCLSPNSTISLEKFRDTIASGNYDINSMSYNISKTEGVGDLQSFKIGYQCPPSSLSAPSAEGNFSCKVQDTSSPWAIIVGSIGGVLTIGVSAFVIYKARVAKAERAKARAEANNQVELKDVKVDSEEKPAEEKPSDISPSELKNQNNTIISESESYEIMDAASTTTGWKQPDSTSFSSKISPVQTSGWEAREKLKEMFKKEQENQALSNTVRF